MGSTGYTGKDIKTNLDLENKRNLPPPRYRFRVLGFRDVRVARASSHVTFNYKVQHTRARYFNQHANGTDTASVQSRAQLNQ